MYQSSRHFPCRQVTSCPIQVFPFLCQGILDFDPDQLAGSTEDLSCFHVHPHFAHDVLGQASLSVLHHLGNRDDKNNIKGIICSVCCSTPGGRWPIREYIIKKAYFPGRDGESI